MAVKKHIQHIKSSVQGKAPTADDLLYGEIAVNYAEGDEQLYIKNSENEIVPLLKEGGITTIEAKGDEDVLTLTATASTDGKTVTIEGSADTYNAATIEYKIAEALTNGTIDLDAYLTKTDAEKTYQPIGNYQAAGNYVTNISASGTSPLTLIASVNSTTNVATITGSVDLSNYATVSNLEEAVDGKQDVLKYYSEGSSTATLNTSNITVQGGSNITLKTESNSSYINVFNSGINIYGYDDINISTQFANSANGYNVSVTTDNFLYNGVKVATVDDIPDISSKQDKLNYYSEGSGSATISTSNLTFQGGDHVLLRTESNTSYVNVWNSSVDISGYINVNISTPISNSTANSGYTVNVTTDKFTYNGEEVATVKDLESKQDVDEALEEIKTQYPDTKLYTYLSNWFDESSEAFPVGAKIIGFDTVNVQSTEVSNDNSCAIIQVAFPTSNQTIYLTNTNTLIVLPAHSDTYSFFNIYVPCTVDTEISAEGDVTHIYTLGAFIDKYLASYTYEETFFGLWNSYLFEGGSDGSTVTIDDNIVTIPANTIVQGTFTKDIRSIPNVNLKKIKIKGDVSLSVSETISSNQTIEEVDLEFSKDFSRSFSDMFRHLEALKRVHIIGGVATSAATMFQSVGTATDNGCEIDIKGMDFSQTNSSTYMFENAKIESIDLSGHKFNSSVNYMFSGAAVNYANLSGCIFNNTASYLFFAATVNKADLSGCIFSKNANYIFRSATVNNAIFNGCKFNAEGCVLFQSATVGNADVNGCVFEENAWGMFNLATVENANVCGCTFKGSADTMFGVTDTSGTSTDVTTVGTANIIGCVFSHDGFTNLVGGSIAKVINLSGCKLADDAAIGWGAFYRATINTLILDGIDLSKNTFAEENIAFFGEATINSLSMNGLTLPLDAMANSEIIKSLCNATKIGAINGSFTEIAPDDFDFSNLDLDRQSMLAIFSALQQGGEYATITLSSFTYRSLTTADREVATHIEWSVNQAG